MGQIPREPPGYQPRTDLLDQLAAGADTSRFTVVHALTGQRGVGKTHLAAAYARHRITQGWPLVAWLTGEDPDQLISGLAQLAERLALREVDDDAVTAAHRVRAWLETSIQPGLLVIDNAEQPAHLAPFLPTGGHTHIVITTTNRAFANTADTVDVTVYTREQAIAYLTTRTRLTDPGGAAALAEEVGHLPLALAQLAWLITSQGKTYRETLHDLRTTPLSDLLRPVDGGTYPHGAAQTILLTAARIEAADPTGHARTVLGALALLSPAGIPRTLLTTILADLPKPVDAPSSSRVLQSLATASLITYALDNTTILIHRLTQRALRDRATHDGTLPTLITNLAAALDEQRIDEDEAWARRAEAATLIDQITSLNNNTPHTSPRSEDLSAQQHPDRPDPAPALLDLRAWAVHHLITVSNPTQAITLGEDLTADATTTLGPDHPDTCYYRDRLATAYQYAGRPSNAITLFEAVLADSQRVLGSDHPDTLATRDNLAGAYQDAGRTTEAITLYEAVLADRQRVLGPDHPRTLTTRHNLAGASQEVQDQGRPHRRLGRPGR